MTADSAVVDKAEQWIADDIDDHSRSELRGLISNVRAGSDSAAADLRERVGGSLSFGTAGMRGPVRAGPNGMNRAVVVRTTAGLAGWLNARDRQGGTVVVGYDARHGSARFAEDAAAVLSAAGFDTRLLPEPLPTPILAHATRELAAVAGIQITASHNPPADNGYKVFVDGGSPLVGPADTEIEAAISRVGPANEVARSDGWSRHEQALNDYLARVTALPKGRHRQLRIAATALHGVGAQPLRYALHSAGFTDVYTVDSQDLPDPDFPTVEFPNPEEPGATDAVLELAEEIGADIAIALDPDADRCAVGTPRGHGEWRMLRGDETGVLLGDHILSTLDASAHPDPLVATTIVSSSMLRSIAATHGARYDETLTGFKWLMRAGDGLSTGLVYAFEEAIGHCVDPDHVRDKDGISAAVMICDLAATLKSDARSLPDRLDELETAHGVHETAQISIRVRDLDSIAETMRTLRQRPPTRVADFDVDARDLLPESDVLILAGAAGDNRSESIRVVIRPSGTEPKLKCYLQVVEPVERSDIGDGLSRARTRAREVLTRLDADVRALVE